MTDSDDARRARPKPADAEWDAAAYHRLSAPQTSWGERVLAELDLAGDERALDAGCGSGRLTARLLERLPRGHVVALDRSANMIDEARLRLAPFADHVSFENRDLLDVDFDAAFDLVFSTATLHWVLDAERLFAALFRALRPGGRFVAQWGGAGNLARFRDHIARVMQQPAFAPHFEGWPGPWDFPDVATAEARLRRAGFVDVTASLRAAPTSFPDRATYAAFVERVVLGSHLARSPEPLRPAFIAAAIEAGEATTPRWSLDYVRIDARARRP
ncbi:MAG TPA: methyltransferase domain-containing protein [Minicystis sp.]|nr:methyltransferase domain-containing protein [Minicystis sp.]